MKLWRFQACTGGGCTVSAAAMARTVESAPSGIQNPRIASPSFSELIVSWDVPTFPNGKFLEYTVFDLIYLKASFVALHSGNAELQQLCKRRRHPTKAFQRLDTVFSVTFSQLPSLLTGIITQYRLYHNGLLVYTHPNIREYKMDNLQPWSLHTFRLEACTSRGCGSSEEVEVMKASSVHLLC